MMLLITFLFICILFLIISIVFFFKGYKRRDTNKIIPINYKERKRKDENRSLTISVIGIIISCLGLILTVLFAIPSPNIYPLDNEAKVYNGTIEV